MKIAIDISEEDYRKVQDGRASVAMMRDTIRNGKVLPIDGDAISRQEILKYFENRKAKNYDIPYEDAIRRIKNARSVYKAEGSEE